jgi:N-acetylglucosamine-6-phosphate deacetylase
MKTILTADRLFTPVETIESPIVVVEDGRIVAMGARSTMALPPGNHLDFPGCVLAPGLIDIHIHGSAGYDVMEADSSELATLEQSLLRSGVTAYLPTTVTAPMEHLLSSLDKLGKYISQQSSSNSVRALGIHLEGPFISHAKRGVHPTADLLTPSPAILERFHQASCGTIRMITIAPELPGALETIEHARKLGILVSIGHSNANTAETQSAVAAGAAHATHTFNAMRPLDHREPGILGVTLSDARLTADIIADGIHVAPAVVDLFIKAKGLENAILITDAISATGKPDGRYRLGAMEVTVRDGRCEHEGKLAGSVLTLDRAVRNAAAFAGISMQSAVRLATLNPARRLALESYRGTVAPGRTADLIVFNSSGEITFAMAGGKVAGGTGHRR